MSGLDTYLSKNWEFGMELPGLDNQLPALYADEIFPQLATIVSRYRDELFGQCTINMRMALIQ